jgi:lysophospholipase L1-like esterase
VDLRSGLIDYNLKHNLKNEERGILTSDRVHLNPTGQQFVAEAMWNEIKKIK